MGWFNWEPEIKNSITREALNVLLPYHAPEALIIFTDNIYQVPADPLDVMKNTKSYKYKYIKERRDCDDFARIFRGILSQKGMGNLLAMSCKIAFKRDDENKSHGIIAFWHHSKLVFGAPQSGKMLDMNKYPDYKIVRLII